MEAEFKATHESVDELRRKLADPEFGDRAQRQSLSNKMKLLETQARKQHKAWKALAEELDEEEGKGILVTYRLSDTEGIIIKPDEVLLENPKPDETVAAEEQLAIQAAHAEITHDEVTRPRLDTPMFSDHHSADVEAIGAIRRKWASDRIMRESRGDAYDLNGVY